MFHLLGFLFILLLVVLLMGVGIISSFIRALFGWGRKTGGGTQQQQSARTTSGSRRRKKKIFTPDDGEYVEFEEIKED
jgi:mannose/fructose/N-acetylgalactosamine-specific phosphotransferase system component IIC